MYFTKCVYFQVDVQEESTNLLKYVIHVVHWISLNTPAVMLINDSFLQNSGSG